MAACALAIDRGVVPPTANWENRDPECDLDYMPNVAVRKTVQTALSTGSGFGGFQSAMILSLPPELRGGVGDELHDDAGSSRRSVITGIGVVAPNGIGTERVVEGDHGRATSGIAPDQRGSTRRSYATQLAGEVDGFDADDWIERRLRCRPTAGPTWRWPPPQMAFDDAEFDPGEFDEWSTSAITASSSGGNEFGQKEIQALWGKGPKFVGAYQSIAWFYAATTGQISIRHGLKGPCGVVIAEGAGGLEALQHARRTIRRGVDGVVSGGLEAPIGPYALTCQIGNGLLSTRQRTRRTPTARSTGAPTATCPARAARSCWSRATERAAAARGAAGLRRDRRVRRHATTPTTGAGPRRTGGSWRAPSRWRWTTPGSPPRMSTSSSPTRSACPSSTRRGRRDQGGLRASAPARSR